MRIVAAALAATTVLAAHDPITTRVTWDREISPIIRARCVSCHSPGGRAPMSLATYDEARPWARAIREEVLARRMPKWHAVRGYGDFTNDPSLSPFEIALITAWVDGGAPRTTPAKPPTNHPPAPSAGRSSGTRPSGARAMSVACTPQALPAGRLLGIKPMLEAGASLNLALHFPDGAAEPLIGIREFDRRFAETYWLRIPVSLPPGTRLVGNPVPGADCRLTLFMER